MINPLINIIVPVYGVEQYLRKCVDSILAQTYNNIRVILVNDGSPDSCPAICEKYSLADERIVVIHRTNGGLSAARNSGLDFLCNKGLTEIGKYVAFIDGDDYIAPDYIEFLYKLLLENHADVAQCGHYIVFSESRKVDKNTNHHTLCLNREQALESLCYNGVWDVTAWNKLYKLEVFSDLRFPEGRLYEDTAVCHLIVEKANRMVVNMEPKYYYIQRYTSTANSTAWKEYKYQFVDAGDEMADWIRIHYPQLTEASNVKRVFVRLSTLSQMINSNHYDKQRIMEMKRVIVYYGKAVLFNPKVAKRDKFGIIAILIGYPFYSIVWKLYYKIVRRR